MELNMKKKILVIDDEEHILELLKILLTFLKKFTNNE